MTTLAFVVVGVLLAGYVLSDGFDLGVAMVAPAISRNQAERAQTMRILSPFLHGNEVWLIAAGGALFALFPQAYATSFSGFYLPFIVVLWLLMFRGMAMELRDHFANELWHDFWDTVFFLSSTAVVVLFGVALGNLVRGLPIDSSGYFTGSFALLLNPFALGVGIFALVALALHGATFAAMRVDASLRQRAQRAVTVLWYVVAVGYVGISAATWFVRPLPLAQEWWLGLFPILSIAALVALRWANGRGEPAQAFAASCVFLATLLVAAAATMFPYIVPGLPGFHGLSIYDTTPSPTALVSALTVSIVGLIFVISYTAVVFIKILKAPPATG